MADFMHIFNILVLSSLYETLHILNIYIYIYIQKATASAADLSKSRLSAVWLRFWGRLLEALADPGCSLQGFCGFGVHWAGQGSKSRLFGSPVRAGALIPRPRKGGGGLEV